jgi:Ran GTPase-activating protein (RanGAP) involved in mRNA processing and transport
MLEESETFFPEPDGPGAMEFLADGALLKYYDDASRGADLAPKHLVARCLADCEQAQSKLLYLDVPGNQATSFTSRLGQEDMVVFSQVFRGPVAFLQRIDLSYNVLGDEGATTLAEDLIAKGATNLNWLSVRGNSIGPTGLKSLCEALKKCPAFRRFDVSLNPLGREGGHMLVSFIHEAPQLLELYAGDTELDIHVLVAVASVLLPSSTKLNLKGLDLSNPRIQTLQEEHTVHLGRMLRVNTSLTEIYLGKHKMRDEGVRQLVSFLLENKTLRVLDLRCNELGVAGAQHLANLLVDDCQIRKLNLENNRIGEKGHVGGAKALAQALTQNKMLTHLNLNTNGLCGDALQQLADGLSQNATLSTLELFHSTWDQVSALKFHQILTSTSRIQQLTTDFITDEVDMKIDICQRQDFRNGGA